MFYGLTTHREKPKKATEPGERIRKTYIWGINPQGEKVLYPDKEIDQQDEINSWLEETKIENIIKRATYDPEIWAKMMDGGAEGVQDFTNMPGTLAELQNLQIQIKQRWDELPREIKAQFDYDSDKFVANYGTESWAKALGLYEEPVTEPVTNPVEEKEVKE